MVKARVVAGRIRYVPTPNYHGAILLHYRACWQRGRCRSGLVRVDVLAVNDKPVAVDDHARGWMNVPILVPVLRNDSDPDGDQLHVLSARSRTGGLVEVVGRRVRLVPPRGFLGTARLTYLVSDGHGGRASATVEVLVRAGAPKPSVPKTPTPQAPTPPTTPPAAPPQGTPDPPPTGGPNASPNRSPRVADDAAAVLEDGTALIDVMANDSDPDGDPLTLVSVTTPSLGAADVSGTAVRYVAPAHGVATTFEYVVRDPRGATGRGTVSVTVGAVNDAPSFAAGADQLVPEGSGTAVVSGWARNISAGPPDEEGQRVRFTVDTDRTGLFSERPAIDLDGTLRFAPAAGANGSTRVTVRAVDDGGTANGGEDTSAPQTFTITIFPVNSAPSFDAGPDQVVAEDSGPRSVAGWARNISPGPDDESGQTVSFTVSTNQSTLFAAGPAVTPNGTLTFTPAANANGLATVTVRAVDSGGTANGGQNTSAPRTFTITITPANDSPVAVDDAVSAPEDSPGVTFDVLSNDTDVDAGDTLVLDSFGGSAIANGTLAANGGGSFTYVPDPAYNGTETFTYVARDGAGATDGATVTITVSAVPTPPTAGTDAYSTSAAPRSSSPRRECSPTTPTRTATP